METMLGLSGRGGLTVGTTEGCSDWSWSAAVHAPRGARAAGEGAGSSQLGQELTGKGHCVRCLPSLRPK